MDEDAALAERAAALAERFRRGESIDLENCDGEELQTSCPPSV